MKVKIKSVIAAALAVLTLLSSMPVMAASVKCLLIYEFVYIDFYLFL